MSLLFVGIIIAINIRVVLRECTRVCHAAECWISLIYESRYVPGFSSVWKAPRRVLHDYALYSAHGTQLFTNYVWIFNTTDCLGCLHARYPFAAHLDFSDLLGTKQRPPFSESLESTLVQCFQSCFRYRISQHLRGLCCRETRHPPFQLVKYRPIRCCYFSK